MKAEATSYQRLREHLCYQGLTTAAENLSGELDRGLKGKLSATQVLETASGRFQPSRHHRLHRERRSRCVRRTPCP